jgi:hypothetical protein
MHVIVYKINAVLLRDCSYTHHYVRLNKTALVTK